MATNFNVTPYYDDFDATKNFHRVLFRPGYAIQARELTQLQTILQNQVTQFGNHVFKDGSQVIPGEVTYTSYYEYVKLSAFSTTNVSDLVGETLTGATNGVQAEVVNSTAATETTAATIYVIYKKTGSNNTKRRFADGESLTGSGSITATVGVSGTALPVDTNATGSGSAVNVQAGIYYVNGFFVRNDEQTLILDPYTVDPSYRVGFTITESFVTPSDDTSLNDNATGTSNANAPGAHRFKIALTLAKKEITTTDDDNFVDLLKIQDGVVESKVEKTDYNILEDTLARRTYDESGDYSVKAFDIDIREHYFADGDAKYGRGIYRADTDSGVTYYEAQYSADESKARLAVGMGAGKAYVKGYGINTVATQYVTIDKARDFDSANNTTTNAPIGNFIQVTNIFGTPDIGFVSGETNAFKKVRLYKSATSSRGTANIGSGASQNLIGVANARFFNYSSGTVGASSSNATSVYDLGLFNISTFTHVATTGSVTIAVGDTLTGGTSGATGVIEKDSDGAGLFILSNVKGTFVAGETVTDESSNSGTVASNGVTTFELANTKQVAIMSDITDDSSTVSFTADTVLTSDSTDPFDASQTTLSGSISVANSATAVKGKGTKFTTELLVGDVIKFNDDTGEALTATVSAIASDTALTIATAVGGADVTTSSPFERRRVKLHKAGDNSLVFKLPNREVKTLKTTDNNALTDTTFTVRRQFVKTLNGSGVAAFDAGANETFDAYADADYTLSIMAMGSGGTGAAGDIIDIDGATTFTGSPTAARQLTVTLGSGYAGHKVKLLATITKAVAGEKTKTLNTAQTLQISTQANAQEARISIGKADIFKINSVFMAPDFSTDATTSHEDVTDRFTLDNGQRDNFYDIGAIVLKPGQTVPTGRLLINFDFFSHSSGDYFSVDSYAGATDYEDIPSFQSPLKGKLELRDCVDFRPRVGDDDFAGYGGATQTVSTFFDNVQTNGPNTGAVPVDLIKPGSDFRCDLEFYLSRIDGIYLTKQGQFKQARGSSAIDPQRPDKMDDAMLLYYLKLPAYTFNTSDVTVIPIDNRRYTMRDIGLLNRRIENLEYYTQLSLLEQTALNTQVQDVNGLDRFKNGFVVDTFKGHNVGATTSLDYLCAMDMDEGVVRPLCATEQVKLVEKNTTDTQRTNSAYQKTGDLITLPYTEEVFVENQNASKSVNVNPFQVVTYVGHLTLSPDLDEWKDTKTRPDLVINNELLYNAVKDQPNQKLATGTVWNEWQNNWTGTYKEVTESGSSETTTIGRTGTATRTGIKKTRGTKVVKQSFGEKIVDIAYAPFIRKNTITFTAKGLKPNTRMYPFFEEIDVSAYCTPSGGSLGGNLVADANGDLSGTFALPSPSISGNPKWRTGERSFTLTSTAEFYKNVSRTESYAIATYIAKGLQVTEEESVYATRVPAIIETTVSQQKSIRDVTSSNTRYLNPSYSSSNRSDSGSGGGDNDRDSDHDGVLDKYDAAPYDRTVQTVAQRNAKRQQSAAGAIGSGGSGGSKSGRIICTWLTSQGLMDQSDLAIDLQFTNDHIAMRTRVGYWTWAYPLVEWMDKNKDSKSVSVIRYLAQARANEIKYQVGKATKPDYVGKAVRMIGEPICSLIGLGVELKEKLLQRGTN